MSTARLPGVGGACTCQRRMCAAGFHPGNSTWGRREGYHRVIFSSQQERCHPAVGPAFTTTIVTRAAAPFHFPPAVTAGSDSCKVPGAPRWGVRFLGDTVAGCPFQARAWGQLLCPERPSLSPPPLTSLRLVVHRI